MKRILKSGILLAIITLALTGCCKDKSDDGTLSPPSWILGEWECSFEMGTVEVTAIYKFTSNDLIMTSDAVGSVTISLRERAKYGVYSNMKETIKTDDIYEITLTASLGTEVVHNFKKGDGTYIEYTGEIDGNTSETFRLEKK